MQDSVEEVSFDHSILWHPSLTLKIDQCCTAFPGGDLLSSNQVKPIQSVYLNNHLYIGGLYCGSKRDKCRLFEYSVTLNTWDLFDIDVAEFALVSYQSKLLLLGGREYKFDHNGFCTSKGASPTKKVWMLNEQYHLQEADIPPMNTPRTYAHAIGHQNYLIIVGGDDDNSNTVEIYDGEMKKWFFAPSLPKASQLQSIVLDPNGNLYIQLAHGISSKVLWTTIKALNESCSPTVQESNNSTLFWQEIPDSLDRVHSNLVLCQDNLLILGGSHQHNEKYMFVYRPSTATQKWIDIADVPRDLLKYTASIIHIVSLSDDQLLFLGKRGSWMEDVYLLSLHGL